MTVLHVVRHPPVLERGICYGQTDLVAPLSNETYEDLASALAEATQRAPAEAVWTSPARRCHRLARRIAREKGLPLEVDARLAELSFGTWEGRAWKDLEQDRAFVTWMHNWKTEAPPEGESLSELRARVVSWLRVVAPLYPAAFVIAHAGVIRAFRVLLEGWTWEAALQEPVPHLSPISFKLDPQAVSELET